MICDRTSAVRPLPEAAGLPAAGVAEGGGKFGVAFPLRGGRFAPAPTKHATSRASFQARHSAECLHCLHNLSDTLGILSVRAELLSLAGRPSSVGGHRGDHAVYRR